MNPSRYAARRFTSAFFLSLSFGAALIGLGAIALILWTLIQNGAAGLNADLLTKMTPPPGESGGMLNAIVGSCILVGLAMAIGTPIAVLAGTYLAEFGYHSRLAVVIRFINDILVSAPSIVIGLFVYEILVATTGHFSGYAGAVALSIIVIPVVVRTTKDMLLLVPNQLREAAVALGSPRWHVIRKVTYKAARAGIITGALLALARISGETAPLLFTALNNQFWSTDLNAPMANLPVMIFQFAVSPYDDWRQLAWAASLLITAAVLFLSIIARALGARGINE
jgi:phosphate transport system permease protein